MDIVYDPLITFNRRTVQQVEVGVAEKGKRNRVSRLFHARNDKEMITSWRSDLTRILGIFNVRYIGSVLLIPLTVNFQAELAIIVHTDISAVHRDVANTHTVVSNICSNVVTTQTVVSTMHHDVVNTHTLVSDIHDKILENKGGIDNEHHSVSTVFYLSSTDCLSSLGSNQVGNLKHCVVHNLTCTSSTPPGEVPPPPLPCFGRDELIEKIVGLAENLTPIALIGAGGIGKTSIALALLHDGHIEKQFGKNRWFIRCDKFPPTLAHFLRQLSNTIGAGVENPEDLLPLQPFLSSREMLIVLDNAESILDPKGTNAQEIYPVVEELSRFKTICLCITSRITTVPQLCKRPIIETLSIKAASAIFYNIYNGSQSDVIKNLLEQLDFHALSITLLATTASHNMWDHNRMAKEWNMCRTQVLQTDFNKSLAATIQLSLTSPMFLQLGPTACDLLSVIAFFPQGVDEDNLEWLFPTTSDRQNIVDKFCVLSLTYRSRGFITMLAPLRDYLGPKDPKSSPLLCTTKECYFSRLSVYINPGSPGFEEAKWIMSEDVNVEHLLDVFTSIDPNSDNVWDACNYFILHLRWHKPQLVMLGPKVEQLPDNSAFKPRCLFNLSQLFRSVGNFAEEKRLLVYSLELRRMLGDEFWVGVTLRHLALANQGLGLCTEGVQQAKESLRIFEQLNHTSGQADSLQQLAGLLCSDHQLDAAEEAISKSINILLDLGDKFGVCTSYYFLGNICHSKGEMEKAIDNWEKVLEIADSSWDSQHFWSNYSLAGIFFEQGRFDDAHAHSEHAKLHAINDPYHLGRVTEQQAEFWYEEGRLREAKSEVLCAISEYEKIGAVKDLEGCRRLLQKIVADESDVIGELLETATPYPC